jgi:hypothetical protein
MPSGSDHIAQAKHNEQFASSLKSDLTYKDWIITVCFYAALHYIESVFFKIPTVQHTITNIPTDPTTGKRRCSEHAWRRQLVRNNCSQNVYIHFQKLYTNSMTARYLDTNKSGLSSSYFSNEYALNAFDKDLQIIKQELGL